MNHTTAHCNNATHRMPHLYEPFSTKEPYDAAKEPYNAQPSQPSQLCNDSSITSIVNDSSTKSNSNSGQEFLRVAQPWLCKQRSGIDSSRLNATFFESDQSRPHANIFLTTHEEHITLVIGQVIGQVQNYRPLLQNIVSFVGLFCKRDV